MLNALKSYTYFKYTICVLMVFCCVNVSCGQEDKLIDAQKLIQEKKYSQAIYILEQATRHEETKNDPQTYYFRAIAYNNYYKQLGNMLPSTCVLLDTSLSSALRSIRLNADSELKKENLVVVENVAKKYFAIAKYYLMDTVKRDDFISEAYYQKFKKTTLIIDPKFNFKENDVNYYNAVGGIYADLFSKTSDSKYSDVGKSALLNVLEIDPKNIQANMNLGILYYNQGAKIIREIDYDTGFQNLDVVQDNAAKLFKQSEPYMIRVYQLGTKDKKVLEGLEGIYHGLNDEEQARKYNKLIEELKGSNQK